MATLTNQSKAKVLLSELKVANSFGERCQGLIGTRSLSANEGLWIKQCYWIHTFFMSMPIDVIYVDKKMQVKKLQKSVKPWRLPAPVFKADSVIELASGALNKIDITIGDQLDVGD